MGEAMKQTIFTQADPLKTLNEAHDIEWKGLGALMAECKRGSNMPVQFRPQDIRTIGDIDIYRHQQKKNGIVKSRYQTMVDLYGRDNADRMMRELEVRSWP